MLKNLSTLEKQQGQKNPFRCNHRTEYLNYKIRGQRAEASAAKYLISLGYKILFRNLKTKFGEVDLLLESTEGEIVLCEVKLWTFYDGGLSQPVGRQQIQRLKKVFQHLQISSNKKIKSLLVAVSCENKIKMFPDFLNE